MFVHCITEFIEQLGLLQPLKEYDLAFIKELSKYLSSIADLEKLDPPQLEPLINIFTKRWNTIKDTSQDYTRNADKTNLAWAKLAAEVAKSLNKHYLSILLPSVNNTIEPLMLTRFSERCSEVSSYYLGEDNSTLYSLTNLISRFKGGKFSTYHSHKEYKPRAISIVEVARIRVKNMSSSLGDHSTAFWTFLTDLWLPIWQTEGEFPHVLSSLVETLEVYFNDLEEGCTEDSFRKALREFSKILITFPVKDVNYLYSIKISVGGKKVSLIEILSDVFIGDLPSLKEKMIAVAGWIAECDPSLIIHANSLKEIYSVQKVGPGFNAAELVLELKKLTLNLDDKLYEREVEFLCTALQEKGEIDPEMIAQLSKMYSQRWKFISGTSQDYTRLQSGTNFTWIRLAQLLAGAGYITEDYYRFLMPTLSPQREPVTLEIVSRIPLSHFILSEDGKWLLFLDNCIPGTNIQAARFYNYNTQTATEFTPQEHNRILFANKKFRGLLKKQPYLMEDPAISLKTILAIKNFVDGSLYPKKSVQVVTEREHLEVYPEAEDAFLAFYRFLYEMPEDEKQRLYAQNINYHGIIYNFKEIMGGVKNEKDCLSSHLRHLVLLVLDYLPYAGFNKQIQANIQVEEFRATSRKKVLREYESMKVSEATNNLLIIFSSLLTFEFNYLPLKGRKISACGYSNTVPKEVESIFNRIYPLLNSDNKVDPRHIYGQIIEQIIKPLLADDSWATWFSLYAETRSWLVSILDGSLFRTKVWFEPTLYLQVFLPMTRTNSLANPKLENFLDYLVKVHLQTERPLMQKVIINIRFAEILEEYTPEARAQMLHFLSSRPIPHDSLLPKLCIELLIHRLATLGSVFESSTVRFFGKVQRYSPGIYKEVKERLEAEWDQQSSIDKMMQGLHFSLEKLINERAETHKSTLSSEQLASYWFKMTNQRVSTSDSELSLRYVTATA